MLLPYPSVTFIIQMRKRSAHRDLELHQTVNAVVEIVKENYLASFVFDLLIRHYQVGLSSPYFSNTNSFLLYYIGYRCSLFRMLNMLWDMHL